MKLHEMLYDIPYEGTADDCEVKSVTADSRLVEKGTVFAAFKGLKNDGHDYAAEAEKKGAAAIICEHDCGCSRQLIVEDSRTVYAMLCHRFFGDPLKKLKLIGVTGTNGKTTVSSLIKQILCDSGKKCGLIGTIKNEIGDLEIPAKYTTPDPSQLAALFSQMVKRGCEYAVMEVSSHALDQKRLAGCRFDCGVFTNLTQDHLDYHKTMERYFEAKRSLFDMCENAVVNYDDEYGRRIAAEASCRVHTYSSGNDNADYTAKSVVLTAGESRFAFVGKGIIERITFPMPGEFSVQNAMAAAVTCLVMGCSLPDIAASLKKEPSITGRAEVLPTGDRGYTVIRDYAHTPDAIEKITKAIRAVTDGRIVLLFGCAGNRDRTKRAKMAGIAAENADFLVITSDNPRDEDPDRIIGDMLPGLVGSDVGRVIIPDRFEAVRWVLDNAEPGDVIILAGKGHEDYQVLAGETRCFDEKSIVLEYLSQKDRENGQQG